MKQAATDVETIKYWFAFGIPVLLILVTGLCRKLIDHQPLEPKYFYLGVDLVIACLAAGGVEALDVATTKPGLPFFIAIGYIFCCILVLLVVMTIHQDLEGKPGEVAWLLGVANGFGVVLLAAFIAMRVKGAI